MGDIRDLLPHDKLETEKAKALVALGYPAVAPLLPELMTWVADANWPVCDIIAPFLASLGTAIVPEIRHVLETRDEQWKYWVLSLLVKGSPEVADAVQDQLIKIAETEPINEDEEETRLVAKEILAQNKPLQS